MRVCICRLNVLQVEFHVTVVPIPHLRYDRDLLVVVVDIRNRSIHFHEGLVEHIHVFYNTLQQESLPLFLI